MSVLMLHNDESTWLATDRLVFGANDIARLNDVSEAAAEIAALRDSRRERLADAEREGFEQGQREGRAEGEAAAARDAADTLAIWQATFDRHVASQRADCAAVACEIVRRIAGEVAPGDWLQALAMRAAEELVDKAPLVLQVHETDLEAVRDRFRNKPDPVVIDVVVNETFAPGDCVLVSLAGSVAIDLDTQLERILALSAGEQYGG